jgi:hypothetical protein
MPEPWWALQAALLASVSASGQPFASVTNSPGWFAVAVQPARQCQPLDSANRSTVPTARQCQLRLSVRRSPLGCRSGPAASQEHARSAEKPDEGKQRGRRLWNSLKADRVPGAERE